MGAGMLIEILAFSILFGLKIVAEQKGFLLGLGSLLLIGLMIWNTVITAHIMCEALSFSFTIGALVAVIYALISIQVMDFIFPTA
ncbi:hypothetical protein [Candidatus Nitrosoglobus terrae]|uniref:hypothetical protein n=1 Tax=Candidatus Nitrosoglobus terrae TaxID=1630141 RepID=UPI001E35F4FA|nr:hypothetical protein [Candidatus Nitrosoglobus terrae]